MTKEKTIEELKNLDIQFNSRSSAFELKKLLKEELEKQGSVEDFESIKEVTETTFEINEAIEEKQKDINLSKKSDKRYLKGVQRYGRKYVTFDKKEFNSMEEASDYNLSVNHV